ncbi:hypothetical protein ACB094_01G368700 [Castanea mollissima]
MAEAVSGEIETENTESQKEANTTNENKSQYKRMVRALEIKIEEPEPSFSFTCRIKRIPDYLRKVNEQAYSPMIISIGPLHYFDKKLHTMEKFKVRYLKSFMKRADRDLENLVSTISGMEERISCCYAETSPDIDTDKFLIVILVDAIFILELIFRNVYGCWESDDFLIRDQMIFIICDLILLENQIPFFVLKKLFKLVYPSCPNSFSLLHLTFKFFKHFNVQEILPNNVKIEHFTDLIRIFQLPQLQSLPKRQTGSETVTLLYSATQLHEAGVKFQVNSSKCLLDITFDFKNGVLEMPCLELYDETEAVIRNVMAFEQYCFGEKIYIRDYYLLLDCLVNTTRDIDLLCDKGIIRNYLGDNKAATSLVNKLNIHVSLSGINPNHNRIFKELNAFYDKRWHKWKATLRHQYFSTPWRIASTIAAIILLVFTFIQTVCSIIQIVPIV